MKKRTRKLCPNCKKPELQMYAGWETGSYICQNCGYLGPLFVEEDIE